MRSSLLAGLAAVLVAITPSAAIPGSLALQKTSMGTAVSAVSDGTTPATDRSLLDALSFGGIGPIGDGNANGSGLGRGWLARWLALGGEGEVVVQLSSGNLSFPHRPAAFPQHLQRGMHLPALGTLWTFPSLPPLPNPTPLLALREYPTPIQACVPPAWPPIRWGTPPADVAEKKQSKIVLVERGGCDFATKVLAAQERGARAVIVGDSAANVGEGRAEGRGRTGGLITMFSPEDTDNIHIPSIFVSRAAFLDLMDILADATEGVEIEISPGGDDTGTLGSMLSFALLMPSCFLLATIAIHRLRVARQQELNRAPPQVVLSLPERIWQPDIVWEKDEDELTPTPGVNASPGAARSILTPHHSRRPSPQRTRSRSGTAGTAGTAGSSTLPLEAISARDVRTPQPVELSDPFDQAALAISGPGPSTTTRPAPSRTKSAQTIIAAAAGSAAGKKRYFSKDECAICMDEFHPGDIVRILPCGHVFHKEECDEWLLKWRKLCPTCRADVTLPTGRLDGVLLTPVSGPGAGGAAGDADEERTVGSRVSRWFARSRRAIFGRRAGGAELRQDVLPADERTLLVDRSDGRV